MISINKILVFGMVSLILNACSITPPAPGDASDNIIPDERQIRPNTSTSAAIKRLIENARLASKQGQMSRAESFLERAIRIEPKNALIWHYLAKLHLFQGHYKRAEGLASKSTSLARPADGDRLLADNWRIVAHARQFQGDTTGAQQAQDKASELSSGNH